MSEKKQFLSEKPANRSFAFGKNLRLFYRKDIALLFAQGDVFFAAGMKVIFRKKDPEKQATTRLLVSVPKRNIKKAVNRNQIKRRMREAYRLNKHELTDFLEEKKIAIDLALIYSAKKQLPFEKIAQAILQSVQQIKLRLEKNRR